jgi:hypothetical protein
MAGDYNLCSYTCILSKSVRQVFPNIPSDVLYVPLASLLSVFCNMYLTTKVYICADVEGYVSSAEYKLYRADVSCVSKLT